MSFSVAHVLFWVAAVACAIAQGAIVRSVLIGSRNASAPAARRPVELAWALAPAFALAAVLVFTWRALPV